MHTHLAHENKIAVDEINYVVDEKITFGIAVDEIKTTNFGLKTLFGGLTSLLKTQLREDCVGRELVFLKTRVMLRSKTRLRLPAWSRR